MDLYWCEFVYLTCSVGVDLFLCMLDRHMAVMDLLSPVAYVESTLGQKKVWTLAESQPFSGRSTLQMWMELQATEVALSAEVKSSENAALEIFEVGQMLADIPDEAYNCYGPCPGFETAEADAMAEAAEDLAELVEIAERSMQKAIDDGTCDMSTVDANLDGALLLAMSPETATLPRSENRRFLEIRPKNKKLQSPYLGR